MNKVLSALCKVLLVLFMIPIIGMVILGVALYVDLFIANTFEPSDAKILSAVNFIYSVDAKPYNPHILTKYYGTNVREEFFYTVMQVDIPEGDLSLMMEEQEVETIPTSAIQSYSTMMPSEVFPSLPEGLWYLDQAPLTDYGLKTGFLAVSTDGRWLLAEFNP